jgi:sigma-B regulation protein RsbU (phosphoserine phosphatase)
MSHAGELLDDSAEELFEDAPCGYLTTDLDGRIVRVNRTLAAWTGLTREQLLDGRRFQDLLAAGGRIFYETHYAPLLNMQGWVREIAVDIVRADGSRLPALVNATLRRDDTGAPRVIRTTVFDATDRRRYEQELVRVRDHEHEVAGRLQRSLLDGALPSDVRFELGVTYLPFDDGLTVGGDWYDAFAIDADRIALVCGDVVGRGIEAAASMGQLRSAIRALASTGLAPGPLLDALDGYTRRHAVGGLATVAYATLDLRDGAMCLACAGHLPPAIVTPGGSARFEMGGRSAPLDAYVQPPRRPQAELTLAPGELIVLFTDGLVERADRSLSVGLDELVTALSTRHALGAQQLTDDLARVMLAGARGKDDVCVLALRRRQTML